MENKTDCKDCWAHYSEYCPHERGEICYKCIALDESKLVGQCKICMRRHKCDKAKQYKDLKNCPAFKVHKLRGTNNDNRNT